MEFFMWLGIYFGALAVLVAGFKLSTRKRSPRGRIDFARAYLQVTPDLGRKVEKGCGHPWSSLIPVESNGEVVAFLCGKCDVWNVELTSPTAIIRLEQDEIKRMKAELRAKVDREFSAMFMDPDARAEAIEEAALRKAEIASAAGERHLISRGGTNNIVNRDYGVFTTGYQPSEWDNVR